MKMKTLVLGAGGVLSCMLFPLFILRYGDAPQFNACLAKQGMQGYRMQETGVNFVTLSYPSVTGATTVSVDFFCARKESCKPHLIFEESRKVSYGRATPEQQQLVKAVDVCRRQGLNASLYRMFGLGSLDVSVQ